MKTLIQHATAVVGLLLISLSLLAQIGTGTLQGIVRDEDNGDPIPFANVVVNQQGQQIAGASTDFDGKYKIPALKPGEYSIKVSVVGYTPQEKRGVLVEANKNVFVDFKLSAGVKLDEVVIVNYSVPLIQKDGSSSTTVFGIGMNRMPGMGATGVSSRPGIQRTRREEIVKLPSRGASAAITTTAGVQDNSWKYPGVQDSDGRIGLIRGTRDNSTDTYIDGVKVRGSSVEPRESEGLHGKKKIKKRKLEPEGLAAGYDLYKQQQFKNVFADPLSTFSIDVDAASYSQVRRSLNMGMLPQPDVIRIEEIVNYFEYDYPQPEGEDPFSIITEVADCPWNKDHKLVHLGLQGKELEIEERPKNNLVFLIDVSGSMSDQDKLPLLKQSLRLLTKELEETDRISIVVYAGAAGVVLPSTSGDKKDRIIGALNRLSAGGSTAGGAGIQLAYDIAEKHFIKKGNNRVILCTDGDFNVGVSDAGGLEKLIEKKRESGVFLTVLGFGTGNFQDHKMETLADKGNGNFAYIDNLQEAQKVLVQEFWGTLFTIAKDVKIQIEFNPKNVMAYRLIGYENRRLAAEDFNDDRKDAGELGAGHTVTALYEVIPVGAELPDERPSVDSLKYQLTAPKLASGLDDELLTVKLRYKKPDENVSKLISKPLANKSIAFEESSDNMRFSAALSIFGMALLDRDLKASQRMKQMQDVINLAEGSKGEDKHGRRAEFIRMAELAMIMD